MKAGHAKTGHTPLARAELPVDTAALARFLIGKLLVRELPEGVASGRIVETEAYVIGDAAGHAYGGMTPRNRALFLERGHAYVYLAYGVSWMLNVSSEAKGVGAGVLIRALEPLEGIAIMAHNRGTERLRDLARGPGRLAQALRIDRSLDGLDLCQERPALAGARRQDRARSARGKSERAFRIGISREADRVLRFYLRGEPVRERRQVAQRMRRPHLAALRLADRVASHAILERVQYLAEIQNPWYDNRHRPEEAWRWRGLLVAAERRLYTTGDKGTGNFFIRIGA